ncbi:MAG: xylulokinase [Planctomycetota bacterium]
MALMGIDIGTSGTRTIIIDERGRLLGAASAEYPVSSPRPLWSEQDPEDWWKAVVKTVRAVLAQSGVKPDAIRGIGLSGQMHGLCCLDQAGKVLRPAILWNDGRTQAECEEITRRAGGPARLIGLVQNPALTGFTAPKILWVRRHEPRIYARTRQFLLPKDYIRFRLTGQYATEVSDASGTLLLDVKKRQWSKALMSKLQIDSALLPAVYESPEVSGAVLKTAATATGLQAGTPVVGGGGDQAAGAVGNGIVKRGVISVTMGTSGVAFAHCDRVEVDPAGRVHTFCHAVPGCWHVMGVVLSAGGALQWARNALCEGERRAAAKSGRDVYEALDRAAGAVAPGSEGLYLLPYFTGERTPHADPYARASFVGLTPRHGKAHLLRATMEGAAYALRDTIGIFRKMKVPLSEVRLSGGGAKGATFRSIQAAMYGGEIGAAARIVRTNAAEGPAYGVALLAGVGTGVWKTVAEATGATIRVTERVAVDRQAAQAYTRRYPVFQRLYPALKAEFAAIHRLEAR